MPKNVRIVISKLRPDATRAEVDIIGKIENMDVDGLDELCSLLFNMENNINSDGKMRIHIFLTE